MSNQRISMRKIREITRLRLGLGYSERKTAESCNVGKATVGDCVKRLIRAGLSWPLPEGLDDAELEAKLYPRITPFEAKGPTPDWTLVSLELKRKGVTRQLLWQEYIEQNAGGLSYSRYCELFYAWLKKSRLSMRQHHIAGEKLFVDFAGTTIPIYDSKTGVARAAQIFVATWGASNYTSQPCLNICLKPIAHTWSGHRRVSSTGRRGPDRTPRVWCRRSSPSAHIPSRDTAPPSASYGLAPASAKTAWRRPVAVRWPLVRTVTGT